MRVLDVHMFGEFQMTLDGKNLVFPGGILSKTMRLLILLLYYGEKGVPRQKLLDILYGDSDLNDAASSLRAVAFRLKKQMISLGLLTEEESINDKGIFRWSPRDVEVHVDVREFESCASRAIGSGKDGRWSDLTGKELRELLRQACRLYGGEFLQEMAADMWVAGHQIRYQEMYFQCARMHLSQLEEAGDYEQMLAAAREISRLYPYEEWFIAEMDALAGLGRWREAMDAAGQSTRILMEKIGIRPSDEMLDKIHQINLHMKGSSKNLLEIQEELGEKDYEYGAYYCDYSSFIVTYRCELRKIERSGQSLYLVLCTMTEKDGSVNLEGDDSRFEGTVEDLSHAIRVSLRRTDVYTRYGKNQFLIILAGLKQEDCPLIYSRIERNFNKMPGASRYRLNYFMAPVTADAPPSRRNTPMKFGLQNW